MSRGTPDTPIYFRISPTGLSPSLITFPICSAMLFSHFAYGIVTLFDHFSNMFGYAIVNVWSPLPRHISLYHGLGSSPFARHYSENHSLIFSSSGYLDVSVPRVPFAKLCIHLTIPALRQVSSLIRISADLCSCAAPRSFSQLVTSFFGA